VPNRIVHARHSRPCQALVVLLTLSLASCGGTKKSAGGAKLDPNVVRYRLPLRENPVDPQEAFRCYGACQPEETPTGYLSCLRECPGFDTTHGLMCADYEIPPHAACFTARKLDPDEEVPPGWVVVATLLQTAIIVSLVSVCAAGNNSSCNSYVPAPQ
jgi:hypothetical protein